MLPSWPINEKKKMNFSNELKFRKFRLDTKELMPGA